MNMQTVTKSRQRFLPSLMRPSSNVDTPFAEQLDVIQTLLQTGEVSSALAQAEALNARAPLDPDVLEIRGRCLIANAQPAQAVTFLEKALTLHDTRSLWAAKGEAFSALVRPRRAAMCFERAVALAPTREDHKLALISCQLAAGAPRDALANLDRWQIRADPLRIEALRQLGRHPAAMKHAWHMAATTPAALTRLADMSQTATEQDAARARAREVLELRPDCVDTLLRAAPILGAELTQANLDKLQRMGRDPQVSPDWAARIHWVLFRVLDDRGAIEEAATCLQRYHAHHAQTRPYLRSQDTGLFTLLTRLRFTPLPKTKSALLPIFVCGLPGSGHMDAGRTLQQGTQNRPARPLSVVGTAMLRLVRQLRQDGNRDVSRDDLLTLQSELREGLTQAADGADVVVDCAGMNFLWSGLIAAALPEARIVHVSRDHVQTGWAMYCGGPDTAHLGCQHDMSHMAAYLKRASALMAHWEGQSPNIVGVSGDALGRPGARSARAMLQHCTLNWSAHCEAPTYAPNRDWHRYATVLAPLRQALRDWDTPQTQQLPCDAFQTPAPHI